MSSDLDRNIKVLSGEAEAELAQERLRIAVDLARQKSAIKERKYARADLEIGNRDGLLPTVAALSRHEVRNYSLSNLVKNMVAGNLKNTLEAEVSDSIGHDLKAPAAHGGVLVPFRLSASGLDTKTDSGGGYLTSPSISKNIIDALRAQACVLRLGGTLVTGLRFDLQLAVEAN